MKCVASTIAKQDDKAVIAVYIVANDVLATLL